jgi:hypothetical protein
MLTKYRIIALIKGIVVANLILRGLTRLLAKESLTSIKSAFFDDDYIVMFHNDCALDEASQETNTREYLRHWNRRLHDYDY